MESVILKNNTPELKDLFEEYFRNSPKPIETDIADIEEALNQALIDEGIGVEIYLDRM